MQSNLMPPGQRLLLAGVGRHVWQSSLTEDGGIAGREFLVYWHSNDWIQDGLQGRGRHYILTSGTTEQIRVSCILMPLIAKTLVLANQSVFYVQVMELARRLKLSDMPDVEILMIDAFNDLRERDSDITPEDKFLVEGLIEEYRVSRRRIFTAGDKPIAGSTWWSNRTIRSLRQRNQEIEVREDGSATNRH